MLPVYVSVATQTDGVIESNYYALSVSSRSSFMSQTLSVLDISDDDDDDGGGCSRSIIGRQRMTSSQTDLTSSDFDFVTSHDSDDFDDDFDELDDSAYEVLTIPSPDESGYSEINDASQEKSSQSVVMETVDIWRIQSEGNGERKNGREISPEKNKSQMLLFIGGENALASPTATKSTNRIVPKMGTKVDFNRPGGVAPSVLVRPPGIPSEWQGSRSLGTRGCQPTSIAQRCNGIHRCEERPNDLGQRDRGSGSGSSPVPLYHSDSERSNLNSPFSLRNLSDWNSDGDTKTGTSFPSPDQPSPEPVDPAVVPRGDSGKTDFLQRLYEQYAHVMYTNEANLHHTMMVQQRLFQQQIANRKTSNEKFSGENAITGNNSSRPDGTVWVHGPMGERSVPVEWVIKRRADGTRYITRRPVPSATRDRRGKTATDEKKLFNVADERKCFNTTTTTTTTTATTTTDDDEAIGEIQTGSQRRQHSEMKRIHRRTKELVRHPMAPHPAPHPALEVPFQDSVQPRKLKVKREQKPKLQSQSVAFQELLIHHSKMAADDHLMPRSTTKAETPLLSVVTI